MKRYIIRITPLYKNTLNQYGKVIFESKLINSMVGFETELPIDDIWNIPHVYQVQEDMEGSFC